MPDLTHLVEADLNCKLGGAIDILQSPPAGTEIISADGFVFIEFTAQHCREAFQDGISHARHGKGGSNCICATCSVFVIVSPPPIPCPESATLVANKNCMAIVPDLTEDFVPACLLSGLGEIVIEQSPPAGAVLGPGEHFVLITVKRCVGGGPALQQEGDQQECETLQTCRVGLTIEPPPITCPDSPIVVAADQTCRATVPNLIDLVGNFECPAIGVGVAEGAFVETQITQTPPPGTLVGLGETAITLLIEQCPIAEQAYGAGALGKGECRTIGMCEATLIVEDQTPPAIVNCPADLTLAADVDCLGAIPDLTIPDVLGFAIAEDNCTPANDVELTQSPAAGTTIGVGMTIVTVTATDEAGNGATCSVTIILEENGCMGTPGPQPDLAMECDSSLSLLMSAIMHAPVCGVGCSMTAMATVCGILMMKSGRRRRRRRGR